MSNESSIFKALYEGKKTKRATRKPEGNRKKRRYEDNEPDILIRPEDDALEDNCAQCGAEVDEEGICPNCNSTDEEVCPDCGVPTEDGICPVCGAVLEEDEEDPLLEDEDPVLEEDEEDNYVNERKAINRISVGKYNMDTVRLMGSMLERAKAPTAIKKAYNMKMYERCAKWLEVKKGMRVDLREGFSKSEKKMIKKALMEMKAPSYVKKAFESGQYSIVSSYIKVKKSRRG